MPDVAALPGALLVVMEAEKTGSAAAREQRLAVQCRVVRRVEQLVGSDGTSWLWILDHILEKREGRKTNRRRVLSFKSDGCNETIECKVTSPTKCRV